jgi:Na+-driven multidrug efflux pump
MWNAVCRIGNVEAAAHAVCFQVWLASSLLVDSLAVSAQALIGQNIRTNAPQALFIARRALLWAVRLGCTLALGLVLARMHIPHLFSDDVAMHALAVPLLWWVAALQPVNALAFIWDGILYGVSGFKCVLHQ